MVEQDSSVFSSIAPVELLAVVINFSKDVTDVISTACVYMNGHHILMRSKSSSAYVEANRKERTRPNFVGKKATSSGSSNEKNTFVRRECKRIKTGNSR